MTIKGVRTIESLDELDQGQQYVDIAGAKIALPKGENYTVLEGGKFSYTDVFDIIKYQIEEAMESSPLVQDIMNALKTTSPRDFFFRLMGRERGTVIIASFITIFIGIIIHILIKLLFNNSNNDEKEKEEEEEEVKESPRDFTIEQLREFDGKDNKPIYIALKGDVFDVSIAKDFYGEGSGYHCFAGREASRAMAKLSFEEEELSNLDISNLGSFERNQLDEWYEKFKYYRSYPIVGRVSTPSKNLKLKRSELTSFKGLQEVPEGRVDAPIYVGINCKILDVSYGGKEYYGEGGPYFVFAGIDASRALAKMSFQPDDLTSQDLSDLTPEQKKTLDDWDKRLSSKYPLVGTII